MSCNFPEEYLFDYLEASGDNLLNLLVSEHLQTCTICREKTAEIKQLFFELGKLEKEAIELPQELEAIPNNIYLLTEEKTYNLSSYLELQKKIFKQQVSFLKYTPGLEFGKRAGTELGKKALQLSGGIMRKGFRMALAKGAI